MKYSLLKAFNSLVYSPQVRIWKVHFFTIYFNHYWNGFIQWSQKLGDIFLWLFSFEVGVSRLSNKPVVIITSDVAQLFNGQLHILALLAVTWSAWRLSMASFVIWNDRSNQHLAASNQLARIRLSFNLFLST